MRIHLKSTRKKLMTVREAFAGNAVVTTRCSKAINQFENKLNDAGVATLDEMVQIQRDGDRYVHANHAGKPWAYTACRADAFDHQ